jgi:hypothetical protein
MMPEKLQIFLSIWFSSLLRYPATECMLSAQRQLYLNEIYLKRRHEAFFLHWVKTISKHELIYFDSSMNAMILSFDNASCFAIVCNMPIRSGLPIS